MLLSAGCDIGVWVRLEELLPPPTELAQPPLGTPFSPPRIARPIRNVNYDHVSQKKKEPMPLSLAFFFLGVGVGEEE